MYRALAERYPYAHCEVDFENPLQLLVATVLSAQTTDVMVTKVTPTLFSRWPTAEALAGADRDEMEGVLRPTGFFRQKTTSVINLSTAIVERFDGEVPRRLADLVTLPGVGRKTANVVLGNAFGVPGIAVDTHMIRVNQRLALTAHEDPVRIEADLMELVPRDHWTRYTNQVIHHGRVCCVARRPLCAECPVEADCPKLGVDVAPAPRAKRSAKAPAKRSPARARRART